MGAGASAALPPTLDKSAARQLAGHYWAPHLEQRFDSKAADDGTITAEEFAEARQKVASSPTAARVAQMKARTASLRATQDSVSATIERIDQARRSSVDVEKRWADMQAKFEQILQQSLAGIPQGAIADMARKAGGVAGRHRSAAAAAAAAASIPEDCAEEAAERRAALFGEAARGGLTLEHVARGLGTGAYKKVLVLSGAGTSVAAGIPDFRSPKVGLYDTAAATFGAGLLPPGRDGAMKLFALDFFQEEPRPFFALTKALFPGGRPLPATVTATAATTTPAAAQTTGASAGANPVAQKQAGPRSCKCRAGAYRPTMAHYFVRLLAEKGLLLRQYTQNVDALDLLAGVPPDKMVAAHGLYAGDEQQEEEEAGARPSAPAQSSSVAPCCLSCGKQYPPAAVRATADADAVPHCHAPNAAGDGECGGLVKPRITFFGEDLPARFCSRFRQDCKDCDLLIIMGTSLQVAPVSTMPGLVGPDVPRLALNISELHLDGGMHGECNVRDVHVRDTCDNGVRRVAEAAGSHWERDLRQMMEAESPTQCGCGERNGCEFGRRCRRITREHEWPAPPRVAGAPLCGRALIKHRVAAVAPNSRAAVEQAVAAGDPRLTSPCWAVALGAAGATARLGELGAEQLRERLTRRLDVAIREIARDSMSADVNTGVQHGCESACNKTSS